MKSPPEELFLAVCAEVARSGSPGTSVERYGIVSAVGSVVDSQRRYQAMTFALQSGIRAAIRRKGRRTPDALRALLKQVEVYWTSDYKP